jgi:serine/threonine protein kinase
MSRRSDIWAFGVTVYQVASLKTPYFDISKEHGQIYTFIKNGGIPTIDNIENEDFKKFAASLLKIDPTLRPQSLEALQLLEEVKVED